MASASGTSTIRMSGMTSSAALTMQAALKRTAASATARLLSIEIGFMSLVESTVECRLDQAHRTPPETPGDCNRRVAILPNPDKSRAGRPNVQRGGAAAHG